VFQAGIRDGAETKVESLVIIHIKFTNIILPKLGDRISVSTLEIPKILGNPGKAKKTPLSKKKNT